MIAAKGIIMSEGGCAKYFESGHVDDNTFALSSHLIWIIIASK